MKTLVPQEVYQLMDRIGFLHFFDQSKVDESIHQIQLRQTDDKSGFEKENIEYNSHELIYKALTISKNNDDFICDFTPEVYRFYFTRQTNEICCIPLEHTLSCDVFIAPNGQVQSVIEYPSYKIGIRYEKKLRDSYDHSFDKLIILVKNVSPKKIKDLNKSLFHHNTIILNN